MVIGPYLLKLSRDRVQKSIFNTLVFNVENDMISQERIPLASFLKRTETELSAYK